MRISYQSYAHRGPPWTCCERARRTVRSADDVVGSSAPRIDACVYDADQWRVARRSADASHAPRVRFSAHGARRVHACTPSAHPMERLHWRMHSRDDSQSYHNTVPPPGA
eukprot:IDg874t1